MQIGCEFNADEAGVFEEIADCRLLAVSDFERDETAGNESGESLEDETAVDLKAVVAGEEGDVRFVIADFDGERVAVGGRDVGWVRDDDFEALIGDGGEKVALEKADAICESELFGI